MCVVCYAKEKVLSNINKLPKFIRNYFDKNDTITYTTKRNIYNKLFDFLSYIAEINDVDDILLLLPYNLENLTMDNILDYKNILLRSYSESSVNSILNGLKGIFKFLYFHKIINRNIMSQITIDNTKKEQPKIPNETINNLVEKISQSKNEFNRLRISLITYLLFQFHML